MFRVLVPLPESQHRMIGIIDYGMGNLRSVQKALQRVGAQAEMLTSPAALAGVQKLILPGVGAFGDGMANLRRGGWVDAIKSFIATGKPFLGICLGMQLLFESSTEDAPSPDEPVPGLAILPGKVVQFDVHRGGQRIKVPHMGWNTIAWSKPDPLLAGIEQGAAVYFVHSFYCVPREPDAVGESAQTSGARLAVATDTITSAVTEYPQGMPFTSTIHRGNVWATQFHPEKSQRVGLAMLGNFAAM